MSWTEALWLAPCGSTHPTVTESPGLWPSRALVRLSAEEMVVPLTDTIVSPVPMPALSAALPGLHTLDIGAGHVRTVPRASGEPVPTRLRRVTHLYPQECPGPDLDGRSWPGRS